MINNANLYNPNNYSSKSILRTQVKENFSDITNTIFDFIAENGSIDSTTFEKTTNLHADYFNEYCEQMIASLDTVQAHAKSKKAAKDTCLTFNDTFFRLSQGLSSKSPITITEINKDAIGERETIYDLEKIRIQQLFR